MARYRLDSTVTKANYASRISFARKFANFVDDLPLLELVGEQDGAARGPASLSQGPLSKARVQISSTTKSEAVKASFGNGSETTPLATVLADFEVIMTPV